MNTPLPFVPVVPTLGAWLAIAHPVARFFVNVGSPAFYEVMMRTEESYYSTAEMRLALGVSRNGLYHHTQKGQGDRRQLGEMRKCSNCSVRANRLATQCSLPVSIWRPLRKSCAAYR